MTSSYYLPQHGAATGTPAPHTATVGQLKPKLPRSISQTNLQTTSLCRNYVQGDWCTNAPAGGTNFFTSTPYSTLTLPAMEDYPPDFKQFVFDQVIDKETQKALESEKCLNWCASATKLTPLLTLGDGNCLLHSASLGMWGFHDRDLILRKAVSHAVQYSEGNTFLRRWQYTRQQDNLQHNVQLEQHQWQEEWDTVLKLAAAEAPPGKTLESLEEFHVFVLANVLRRPVIMYAVPKIRSVYGATLQRVNFHGVYLPLLWDPASCKKDPLPLAYYGGHFSSLVAIEYPQQYRDGHLVLPLMDYYSQHLPFRFLLSQEDPTAMAMDYLNLTHIPDHGSPYITSGSVVCAKLRIHEAPTYLQGLISGFIDACYDAHFSSPAPIPQQQPRPLSSPQSQGGGYAPSAHAHATTSTTYSEGYMGDRRQVQPSATSGGMEVPIVNEGSQNQSSCLNNCGNVANTEFGLCTSCYRKHVNAEQEFKQVPVDTPPTQPRRQHHEPPATISSGYMKCHYCPNPGHPDYRGLCEGCYQQTQAQGQHAPLQQVGSSQFRGTEGMRDNRPDKQGELASSQPPPLPPPRQGNKSGERSQCRMPGCDYFGTEETRFYCSKCFDANMDKILQTEVGTATTTASTPVNPGAVSPHDQYREPCHRCQQFYGSPEYNGLCKNCFLKWTESAQPKPTDQPPVQPPPTASTYGGDQYAFQSSAQPHRRHTSARPSSTPPYDKPSAARGIHTTPVQTVVDSMGTMSLASSCFICEGKMDAKAQLHTLCPKHAEIVMQSMMGRPQPSGQQQSGGNYANDAVHSAPGAMHNQPQGIGGVPYTYATGKRRSGPQVSYAQSGSTSPVYASSSGQPATNPVVAPYGYSRAQHGDVYNPQYREPGQYHDPQAGGQRRESGPYYDPQAGGQRRETGPYHDPQEGGQRREPGQYYDPQAGGRGEPGQYHDPRVLAQHRQPVQYHNVQATGQFREAGRYHDPQTTGQYQYAADYPHSAGQYHHRQYTTPVPTGTYEGQHDAGKSRTTLYSGSGGQAQSDPSFVRPKPSPAPGVLGQPKPGEVLIAGGYGRNPEEPSGKGATGASGYTPPAAVAAGAGGKDFPVKVLCKTPGCSFKGVNELGGLCPDCYEETYNKEPTH